MTHGWLCGNSSRCKYFSLFCGMVMLIAHCAHFGKNFEVLIATFLNRNLSTNLIGGPIPPSFGNMTSLTTL